MTPERIAVGGRIFAPAAPHTLTAVRDDWTVGHVYDAGLHELPQLLASGEDPVRAVLLKAVRSGRKQLILAAALDELDPATGRVLPWTAARAEALAQWFGERTDPADKLALDGAFVGTLVRFFRSALGSSNGSVSSSSPAAPLAHPSASPTTPSPTPAVSTSSWPPLTTSPSSTSSAPPAPDSVASSPSSASATPPRRPTRRRTAIPSDTGAPPLASSPATTTTAPAAP
jgi:hypothetical protein